MPIYCFQEYIRQYVCKLWKSAKLSSSTDILSTFHLLIIESASDVLYILFPHLIFQAMDSLIGEVFDDVSFQEFEESDTVS